MIHALKPLRDVTRLDKEEEAHDMEEQLTSSMQGSQYDAA